MKWISTLPSSIAQRIEQGAERAFQSIQEHAAEAKSIADELTTINFNATKEEKSNAISLAQTAANRNVFYTFVALVIAILLAGRHDATRPHAARFVGQAGRSHRVGGPR